MVTFDVDSTDPDFLEGWDELTEQARAAAGDPSAALLLAPALTALLPLPGTGDTQRLWQALAELGAIDLTVARALEPHLDAMAILAQAGSGGVALPHDATWGVFAAEGPGSRLEATGTDSARLTGRKPWCSLAGQLDMALVTAWTSERTRRLFAVDLHHEGVRVSASPWAARGLAQVISVPVDFDDVPAIPVGQDGWYLGRPGFAWGGIGVAAIWFGGAAGLVRSMLAGASRRPPDQVALQLLGRADAALHAAAGVLAQAAAAVDRPRGPTAHAWPEAVRVRHVVHDACEVVLRAAGHFLGPGPLTSDEEHARRVSDLEVYIRQAKAERDEVTIGEGVLEGMATTWR